MDNYLVPMSVQDDSISSLIIRKLSAAAQLLSEMTDVKQYPIFAIVIFNRPENASFYVLLSRN